MVITRFPRAHFLALLGALLLLATLAAATPEFAAARPYDSGPATGEPYGTGDPTGDDQPSPTPKPNSVKAAKLERGSGHSNLDSRPLALVPARPGMRWVDVLRIVIRLSVR